MSDLKIFKVFIVVHVTWTRTQTNWEGPCEFVAHEKRVSETDSEGQKRGLGWLCARETCSLKSTSSPLVNAHASTSECLFLASFRRGYTHRKQYLVGGSRLMVFHGRGPEGQTMARLFAQWKFIRNLPLGFWVVNICKHSYASMLSPIRTRGNKRRTRTWWQTAIKISNDHWNWTNKNNMYSHRSPRSILPGLKLDYIFARIPWTTF